MEAIKNFFTKDIKLTNSLSLETWVFFAVVIAIILIVIVIINSVKNSKAEEQKEQEIIKEKSQNKDLSPKEASQQFFDVIDIPSNEKTTKKIIPIQDKKTVAKTEDKKDSVKKQPIKKENTSQNKVVEKSSKPKKEETKKVAPKKAETKVEPKKAEPKSETKKAEPKTEPKKVEPKIATIEDADETFIVEEGLSNGVAGKYTIVNSSLGGFRYLLLANNGQLLYESRDYKAKKTCMAAIPKFQNAVKTGTFTAKKDKFNRYKFILKPNGNVNTIFMGESFNQNSLCLSNIESTKRFVDSPIVDRTDEENLISKSSAYEIPKEIKEEVTNNQGAKGTFEIAKVNEEEKTSPFVYLLYANNGQLLYESKEYKTYASCKNGMHTFIETVQNGVFIVDADKAGRFKFVLRSNKVGSQAEYVGQFYRNKQSCESSIDSVYKFALLSQTDEL